MDKKSLLRNKWFLRIRQGQFFLAVVIFSTLALIPNPERLGAGVSDLVLHFIGNVLLFGSAWVACLGRYNAWMPLFFVVPFSVLIELSQGLTSYRTPELGDIAANVLGLFSGLVICLLIEAVFFSEKKQQYS